MLEKFKSPELNPTYLSKDELFARICVRPPYYALTQEHFINKVFSSEAIADLPQGLASGPMRSAEISRHAAIAGTCVIALHQQDLQRRFYLATKASYQGFFSDAPYGTPIQLRAEVSEFGKRQARAKVHVYIQQQLLARLEVEYAILPVALFERLNLKRKRITGQLDRFTVLDDYPIQWQGNTGTKIVPHLPIQACAGHFNDYPAAPVALLMDQLSRIAERSINKNCYASRAEVTSANLCWAGETTIFRMTQQTQQNHETYFTGDIQTKESSIGSMNLWLSTMRNGE
jgi:hypothetical protein